MKKFISAVTALAMTAGMMASMSVVSAETSITDEAGLKAAFESGGEYVLANDITVSSNLTPKTSLTLNLDDHTIDLSEHYIDLSNAGDYKFENGTITSQISETDKGTISLTESNAKIELSKIKVTARKIALYTKSRITGIEVTVKDSIFNNTLVNNFSYGTVTVNSGKITITDSIINYMSGTYGSISGVRTSEDGSNPIVTLNNVNILRDENSTAGRAIAVAGSSNYTQMSINGGMYQGVNSGIYWGSKQGTPLTISGGTFTKESGNLFTTANNSKITITSGTFGADPSAFVDTKNYDVTNENGTWTVKEKYVEPTEQPTPIVSAVTATNDGLTEDGITTKVFKFNVNGSFNQVTVGVDGKESQKKSTPEITDGNVMFAIVFIGAAETVFPEADKISIHVE